MLPLGALAAALVLAACGSSPAPKTKQNPTGAALNGPQIAKTLLARAQAVYGPAAAKQHGARITGVSCPAGIGPHKGATYVCNVTFSNGVNAHLVSTEADAKGTLVHIHLTQ